ncbi:Aldo-ket-red domain-containing protein [Mycena chlorophos]|uniref:Aldo-ket-red domain-containing protein n=1 Tax=Mycena chlorophos TaxID=658473 RepID=A0A8H6SNW6_MYCCL|nr:Aldo-ket-red domain-containing protein [Mycena chlorophos]
MVGAPTGESTHAALILVLAELNETLKPGVTGDFPSTQRQNWATDCLDSMPSAFSSMSRGRNLSLSRIYGSRETELEVAIASGHLLILHQNQTEVGAALERHSGWAPLKRKRGSMRSRQSIIWGDLSQPRLIRQPIAFPPSDATFPIHPSNPDFEVALDTTTLLVEMAALRQSKVQNIGVSFTIEHINSEIARATGVVPMVNQIEAHPLLQRQQRFHPLGNNIRRYSRNTQPSPKSRRYAAYRRHESRIISNYTPSERSAKDLDRNTQIGAVTRREEQHNRRNT